MRCGASEGCADRFGPSETTLDDLIADPKHKHMGQVGDDELVRHAVREVAVRRGANHPETNS